jgi:Ras-related protein Rab-6A
METTTPTHVIAFIGPYAIGKSSLSYRIMNGTMPNSKLTPTCTPSDYSFTYSVAGQTKTMTIRDTAGQERYRSLVPCYLRHADCAAICFDPGAEDNWFDSAQIYVELARRGNLDIQLIAIATRCDEWDSRLEMDAIERSVREKLGIQTFVGTSAKCGYGVEKVKEELAKIKKLIQSTTSESLVENSRPKCC